MATSAPSLESDLAQRILRALQGLDYGSVEVIVQDGRVVQIERHQKSRLARPLPVPPTPSEK